MAEMVAFCLAECTELLANGQNIWVFHRFGPKVFWPLKLCAYGQEIFLIVHDSIREYVIIAQIELRGCLMVVKRIHLIFT